jgi:transcriptional regulator with XRE-family HTH domain
VIRYENLRHALTARRKQLGLSQKALADKMGIFSPALNQLETGRRPNPTLDTLSAWCRALDGRLDIGVVFDEEPESPACGLDPRSPADACSCTDTCAKRELSAGTARP